MAAAVAGNVAEAQRLIEAGADVNERAPILSDFNDGQIPLHIAARDGHTGIVRLLLDAGSDVNAVDPVFVSVPLHKATYNGHAEIARMLAHHPGVDLDFQGGTNGYTPLLDALWHGSADCAQVLIQAGARLDLRGHDGKTALDLALEALGPESPVAALLRR